MHDPGQLVGQHHSEGIAITIGSGCAAMNLMINTRQCADVPAIHHHCQGRPLVLSLIPCHPRPPPPSPSPFPPFTFPALSRKEVSILGGPGIIERGN